MTAGVRPDGTPAWMCECGRVTFPETNQRLLRYWAEEVGFSFGLIPVIRFINEIE